MLHTKTLAKLLELLKQNKISIQEVYKDVDKATKSKNSELNIYLSLNEKAKSQAKQAQKNKLCGLPIAVKDNFCTKEITTTASSNILRDFVPQYESTVTTRLQENGGVIYGKTNLDAWAHGSSTETSDFGRTLNPRNTDYLPGGSSGGSAAAIAADMAIGAIGSETAGSIRQPASWCGAVGLKPTYGRVSRYGVIAMCSSTDSPGPIGKTVEDAALLLNSIAGHDEYDGTSGNTKTPDFTSFLNKDISSMKIGLLYSDIEGAEIANEQLEEQIKVFEKLGAKVAKVKAMDPRHAIGVYTVVQRGEVSSNLARFDGIRMGQDRSHFGDEAKRRIMLGTYTLSKGYAEKYYELAQKVRTQFIDDFNTLFSDYDILISPTSPGYAKKVGATEGSAMFGELEDMFLEPSSIVGLPGISIPYYHDEKTNLYLGMNIVAPMWQEGKVLSAADAFEKNTSWNSWRNNA